MKKGLLLFTVFLLGCQNNGSGSIEPPVDTGYKPMEGNVYENYVQDYEGRKEMDSFTAGINCQYLYTFVDDTKNAYHMDGVFEANLNNEEPIAHMNQHINANGVVISMDGYYYDGTFYNDYSSITYYEEMSYNELKEALLIPMEPTIFPENVIESIIGEEDEANHHRYTITLNKDYAQNLFTDRYDFNDLNKMDDYEVTECVIEDIYDGNGNFVSEKTTCSVDVSYQTSPINIVYTSEVNYVMIDRTDIILTDEQKAQQAQYVSYENIDISELPSNPTDENPDDKPIDLLKKRLLSRLQYSEIEDGIYEQTYNQNEAYTFDFNNHTFIYSNYSIRYVYNWIGDIATMGACTYQVEKDIASSECKDSTLEMMRTVKDYFAMELYYCGLSESQLLEE